MLRKLSRWETQLVLTVKPTDKPTIGHETCADWRQNKDNHNDDPIHCFGAIIWKIMTQGGQPRAIVVFKFRNSKLCFFAEFSFGRAPFPSAIRRLVNSDQTYLLVLENWNRCWKWLLKWRQLYFNLELRERVLELRFSSQSLVSHELDMQCGRNETTQSHRASLQRTAYTRLLCLFKWITVIQSLEVVTSTRLGPKQNCKSTGWGGFSCLVVCSNKSGSRLSRDF